LSGSPADGFLARMNAQIQILFLMISGWVNRHQQAIIEHLQEEDRILLEQLGGKPGIAAIQKAHPQTDFCY
jgi:hypothetical protein